VREPRFHRTCDGSNAISMHLFIKGFTPLYCAGWPELKLPGPNLAGLEINAISDTNCVNQETAVPPRAANLKQTCQTARQYVKVSDYRRRGGSRV
jgi:hypothetical protein